MRGVSTTDSYIQPSACRNVPLIRLAALDTFSPKGRRLCVRQIGICRSGIRGIRQSAAGIRQSETGIRQSLPPSGGRWHPASHGSRMTDEGGYRPPIRIFNRLLIGTSPSSVSLRSTPSPQRGEGFAFGKSGFVGPGDPAPTGERIIPICMGRTVTQAGSAPARKNNTCKISQRIVYYISKIAESA